MHIIVGIDPGKTTAIACLDLNGKLLFSDHKTYAGVEWLVSEIEKIGVPSIIACDKEPSEVVRRVGAAFRARLFYPSKVVSIEEKRGIAKPFGVANPHERDALSASVKAYNAYSNKLKQASHLARENNADADSVMAKVIERYSIDEALSNRPANRR